MSSTPELADWQWLISDDAARWLRLAGECTGGTAQATAKLRRQLSAPRAALVLEQNHLRRIARRKFARAEEMFFERRALEQATDEGMATYKAQRLAAEQIVDVCCGIGGDLLALAKHARHVAAVDRSALMLLLAQANARVHGSDNIQFHQQDAQLVQNLVTGNLHIDPDRRARGQRVAQVAAYEPPPAVIDSLVQRAQLAAVKLAPAADVAEQWAHCGEREWIESERECKQQLLWFGANAAQGLRAATVLNARGDVADRWTGCPGQPAEIARAVQAYMYDPSPALLASGLLDHFAQAQQLQRLGQSVYLTADWLASSPFLAAFRVREVIPFDVRRLKRYVREHALGQLEIKKRGVDILPERLAKQLRVAGSNRATILLVRLGRHVSAVIGERCAPEKPAENGAP